MKRKRSSRRKTQGSAKQGAWARLPLRQIAIVGGVLILIGAVLFLKTRRTPAAWTVPISADPTMPAASAEPVPADPTTPGRQVPPTSSDAGSSASPVAATTEAANTTAPSPTPNPLAEAQLDRLLKVGDPVFLFFHSNRCAQCVRMIGIVEQVYPGFSDSVALVDVNVYDERNRNLLQRANIRAIPTLIFVDREGEVRGHVGVMEPDALRDQLRQLEEE
jgi:hypothetical protein